jgi:hypothetical protein
MYVRQEKQEKIHEYTYDTCDRSGEKYVVYEFP